MIGEEIQRARGLLAAVIREGMLSPEAADQAYEAWAAASSDGPFSRHLIRQGIPADRVRLELRRAAVLGLPNPDRFTYERFEDLLVGQLGIEAGMLSPKLLRSVRAVQDKKVAEGKLRRLSDLLPRAGVDKQLLGLLYQHMQERILLCRGCLGRYPRGDLETISVVCPRCGDEITAEALEPSEMLELKLADEEKSALAASSAHMLATRDRDSSVTDREEKRLLPERKSDLALLMVVGVLSLVVVGGLVGLVLMETAPPKRRPVRGPVADSGEQPSVEPASKGGAHPPARKNLAQVESEAIPLVRAGRYSEAQALYEGLVAGGEARAEEKLAELRLLGAQAREVEALLGNVSLDRPVPPENERRMSELLAAGPKYRSPPFDALARTLKDMDAARRRWSRKAAQERYQAARQQASPDAALWERRAGAVSRARPLYGVWLGGRSVDGVRVLAVSRAGYKVAGPDGEAERTWTGDPLLGLRVFEAVADQDLRSDQLELLRLALLARDPLATTRARGQLGLALDTQALLRAAPTSIPPWPMGDGQHRLRYPLAWLGADLQLAKGTTARPSAESLVLEGKDCALTSVSLPMLDRPKREPLFLAVTASLTSGTGPHLDLVLEVTGSTRRYRASWSEGRWSLSVDVGAGAPTELAQGDLGSASGEAQLAFTGREVVFSLGGRELGRTSVWARFPSARFAVGAEAGPLRIESLRLEGHLDGPALARAEQNYQRQVARALDLGGVAGGAVKAAALSVESPQALAAFSQQQLGKLAAAKTHYLRGQAEEAEQLLRYLEQVSEGQLVSATYYRACLALHRFDCGAALGLLEGALARGSRFPEALALRALALVLGGRTSEGLALVDEVQQERPDLAALHLARAWAIHLGRDRAVAATITADQRDLLDLALNLAPGDPLMRLVERALQQAVDLERSFPARHLGVRHVVLCRAEEEAKELCVRLDRQSLRFESTLGREAGRPRPLVVALVLHDAFVALAGPKARAGWFDPHTRVLFVDASGQAEDPGDQRALTRAVAAGYLARRFGPLAGWLEAGMSESLSAALHAGFPEDLLRILADNDPWTFEAWTELFALGRDAVQANPLARARALGLLSVGPPQRTIEALRAAAQGRAVRWSPEELERVEGALAPWVAAQLAKTQQR